MRNIIISLLIGVAVLAALWLPGLLSVGEAAVPAVLAVMVAYFVLARRTFKQVEGVFLEASRALQSVPPKLDLAVATLERAYAYAPHQIGVRSQVDSQIGVIYFLQKQFNKAAPYLERSLQWGHWLSAAMLAVIYYKKKDHERMHRTFEVVLKKGKKQSLAWNLYAYLLCQTGNRDRAQQVLIEGIKKTKDDPKLKESLLALQNGKKLKLKSYKEQWYQFHLERPPTEYQQVMQGGKMGRKVARRGRW